MVAVGGPQPARKGSGTTLGTCKIRLVASHCGATVWGRQWPISLSLDVPWLSLMLILLEARELAISKIMGRRCPPRSSKESQGKTPGDLAKPGAPEADSGVSLAIVIGEASRSALGPSQTVAGKSNREVLGTGHPKKSVRLHPDRPRPRQLFTSALSFDRGILATQRSIEISGNYSAARQGGSSSGFQRRPAAFIPLLFLWTRNSSPQTLRLRANRSAL